MENNQDKQKAKKVWQSPELKKLSVEATAGGSIPSDAEHVAGTTSYKNS